jgi:[protein-PII] uridylyltransferase
LLLWPWAVTAARNSTSIPTWTSCSSSTSRFLSSAKDLVVEVLYPLWDIGLDLGHAVRGIKDCLTLAGRDFEVLTSMMDARFICGDSPLFLSLVEQLRGKTLSKKTAAFAQWLAYKDALRMATFGDASYLLEPNLKEGIGGLRDHHHILWLAKAFSHLLAPRDLEYQGILTHREYQDLEKSILFVGLVRNHLHRLSGRRNDRLFFDYQEKIARILGFKDQGDELAVERFLGKLHTHMATVKSLHRSFVLAHIEPKLGGKKRAEEEWEICIDSATSILRDPLVMMDIFLESCRREVPPFPLKPKGSSGSSATLWIERSGSPKGPSRLSFLS